MKKIDGVKLWPPVNLEATKHLDFKVEPAGLFVDKTRAYIVASPENHEM